MAVRLTVKTKGIELCNAEVKESKTIKDLMDSWSKLDLVESVTLSTEEGKQEYVWQENQNKWYCRNSVGSGELPEGIPCTTECDYTTKLQA